MLSAPAPAQMTIGLGGHVILDEEVSREIRQDVASHLDSWAAWNGSRLPGIAPAGRQPLQLLLFPEIPIEVKVTCDGRTLASTATHAFLTVSPQPGAPVGGTAGKKNNAEGLFSITLLASNGPRRNGMHALTRSGVAGCTLTAFLPGFQSSAVTIPEDRLATMKPIELRRAEGFSGVLLSPTLWPAPKEAHSLFKAASDELRGSHNDPAKAIANLQHAVEIDPHYAQAWTLLAALQEPVDSDAARASYKNAIAADPAYIFPYQPLMRLEVRQAAWQEVSETATQLLKLCPHGNAEAWYDLAFAADQLERVPQAELSARRGIEEDPDHIVPELERLFGTILAKKGDNADAAEHFRNYLKWSPGAPDAAFMERRLALAEPAAGGIPAGKGRSIADLVSLVRSGLKSGTGDAQIARSLRDNKFDQRLDDRTAETLESEGAGPQATRELRRLRDESVRLPLPASPAIEAPAAPSPELREQSWAAAAGNSLSYTDSLPNFICAEEVRRYLEPDERPYDTLRLTLTYFNQKEDYRLIAVNGGATQNSYEQVGGATTKGEFGSELTALFSNRSGTEHVWDHWTTLRKRPASVYYFRIPMATSPFKVEYKTPEGDHIYSAKASQQGFLYIDAATNRVVRISWQSENVPLNFQMQSGATQLDYDFREVGGASYLLPIASETRIESLSDRYRNDVEFRDYRKFAADSNIKFDTIKR